MQQNQAPSFVYADFAPQFTAEFFNATQWVELFKASGARYVIPTSKHHEGYCMWPSPTSASWNSVDCGPKRDIIGEIANATREAGLTFGVYHSLFEWCRFALRLLVPAVSSPLTQPPASNLPRLLQTIACMSPIRRTTGRRRILSRRRRCRSSTTS